MINDSRVGRWMLYALICAIGGIFGGLAVAVAYATVDELPAWIQAVGSISAVLVSIIAVVLVKGTLDATNDTLRKTDEMVAIQKDMAQDQRAIGHAQTRPWIYLDEYEMVKASDGQYSVRAVFMNYGQTPASDLRLDWKFVYCDYIHERKNEFLTEERLEITDTGEVGNDYKSGLPRGKPFNVAAIPIDKERLKLHDLAILKIELNFKDVHGVRHKSQRVTIDVNYVDNQIFLTLI